jgi:hypothetical protein
MAVTVVAGLMVATDAAAECTLAVPTSACPCTYWRCRLLSSTVSSSTMPIVPTPAAASAGMTELPSPPAPITSTRASASDLWAGRPKPGNDSWREYLPESAGVSCMLSIVSGARRSRRLAPDRRAFVPDWAQMRIFWY